ncbi:hypothetical protein FRC00_011958 [Tulasnella sp. 408]|nr:hypothetical protein FRC00_011958 [Tulasnella sp. 408]
MWCDISSAFSPKRVRWAINKSAGRRLHIFLEGPQWNAVHAFYIVLGECHRWAELRISAGLSRLLRELRLVSLPLLESAQFQMGYRTWSVIEPPNLLGSPGLRSLVLDTTPLNWLAPSVIPKGIRSLSIRVIQNGPTFSQLFALLSEIPLLEELQLERLGPPRDNQPASSNAEQRPLELLYLRKLVLIRVEGTLPSLLLSSIRAENCHSLVAVPVDPVSSRNLTRSLRAILAPMASFTEKLFLNISSNDRSRYAVLSTLNEHHAFAPRAGMKTTGFTIGFPLGPGFKKLQEAVSFIAYTTTPISMSIHCFNQPDQTAINELDWDQLPSLDELAIHRPCDPLPILFSLCKARGPRKSPRWPCPRLTVLRLPGQEYLGLGFRFFLHQRWGPLEHDALKRDASRPARLTLCQAQESEVTKLLSLEEMGYFADVWEEPMLPPEFDLLAGFDLPVESDLDAGFDLDTAINLLAAFTDANS